MYDPVIFFPLNEESKKLKITDEEIKNYLQADIDPNFKILVNH